MVTSLSATSSGQFYTTVIVPSAAVGAALIMILLVISFTAVLVTIKRCRKNRKYSTCTIL